MSINNQIVFAHELSSIKCVKLNCAVNKNEIFFNWILWPINLMSFRGSFKNFKVIYHILDEINQNFPRVFNVCVAQNKNVLLSTN